MPKVFVLYFLVLWDFNNNHPLLNSLKLTCDLVKVAFKTEKSETLDLFTYIDCYALYNIIILVILTERGVFSPKYGNKYGGTSLPHAVIYAGVSYSQRQNP